MKAAAAIVSLVTVALVSCATHDRLPLRAEETARQAVSFLRDTVSMEGGFLYRYTADLSDQWGEVHAKRTTVWVEPPGTPYMGRVFLDLWRATGDELYLNAAMAAADALVKGQLQSGGWDYSIDFAPEDRVRTAYRVDVGSGENKSGLRNTWTLDDNVTQEAIRLLIEIDEATGFEIERYHDAVRYALTALIDAQFENGAWAQRYPLATRGYSRLYTFNDNAINDAIDVMLKAWEKYGEERYLQSALSGGAFIVLSQYAAPQSGWAQQYEEDLSPAWARAFEPPAICSAVTLRNINTLIDLYLRTGESSFLEPIPAALEWLETSVIPIPGTYFEFRAGQPYERGWARFYEVGTNTPIFGDRDGEIHYTFDEITEERKRGYGWYRPYSRAAHERYEAVKSLGREEFLAREAGRTVPPSAESIEEIVAAHERDGRWLDPNGMISMRVYGNNLRRIAQYLSDVNEGCNTVR